MAFRPILMQAEEISSGSDYQIVHLKAVMKETFVD